MAVIDILNYPDPRLKRAGRLVTDPKDPEVRQMLADLRETLAATPHCGGLAATQMAFENPFAMSILYRHTDRATGSIERDTVILINPEIIEQGEITTEPEGCMSIYPQEIFVKVSRPSYIKVRSMDENGGFFEFEGRGYIAKCIHHEMDHLKGVINLDYLSRLRRELLERKIAKVIRRR